MTSRVKSRGLRVQGLGRGGGGTFHVATTPFEREKEQARLAEKVAISRRHVPFWRKRRARLGSTVEVGGFRALGNGLWVFLLPLTYYLSPAVSLPQTQLRPLGYKNSRVMGNGLWVINTDSRSWVRDKVFFYLGFLGFVFPITHHLLPITLSS